MKRARTVFPPAPDLWAQALAALLAILCAYTLTVALSIACLVLPLWVLVGFLSEPSSSGPQGFLTTEVATLLALLAAGGLGTCVASLWQLAPKGLRFRPPGPRLWPDDQARLFAEIREISESFGIRARQEVYLCPDMVVSVNERNGLLGIRRRAILFVGLPALEVLTVAQFRAMAAIGFAHIYAGDTALNPWINSMVAAMARVLQLSKSALPRGFLTRLIGAYGLPFRQALVSALSFYWKPFLRIAQNVALRLERRADSLACYLAGTGAFVSGLQAMYRYFHATSPYWNIEVAPVVNAGYIPPLAEGFLRFTKAPRVDRASAEFLDAQMNRTERTQRDPLPLLRDRIAATPVHTVEDADSGAPAIELLANLEETERRLIAHVFPAKTAYTLRAIAWGNVAGTVYVPAWRASVRQHAHLLAGLSPQSLPNVITDLRNLSARFPNPPGRLLDASQRMGHFRGLLQAALSLVLMDGGWESSAQAGELIFIRDGVHFNLTGDLNDLESGKMPPEKWLEHWRLLGLAGVPLAVPAPARD